MEQVILSLGSNQGDRLSYLRMGLDLLRKSNAVKNVRSSSIYETAPWGLEEQPAFLNMVVIGDTELAPLRLLELCQQIESECDRNRHKEIRWGPRTLDIDIVVYNDIVSENPKLTLPHPRAHERAFVLIPMLELDPQIMLRGESVKALTEALGGEQYVELYAPPL